MRIVWLTWKDLDSPLAGGAEVVNEELAARLAAAGHEVTFLTGGWTGAQTRTQRRGFTIIRTGRRFTTYLTTARYYLRHRRELAPDLVIDECNTMPYFAAWYTGAPTVMFFHMLCREIWRYQFPWPLSWIGYLAEPVYLRLAALGLRRQPVISVSESTKADLIRHGFAAKRIHIISEGSNVEPLASLQSAPAKFPEPTILSHGSVRPMKRTLDQVRAFELAKLRLPALRLIISGDTTGRYGEKVRAAVRCSPYAADITLLGRTTEAQKIELMQKSHLITVTSVKEGWGLIVTEAASQGTPAVVYDVDGLRDAVRNGETGRVTRQNPAALADAVVELLEDVQLYAAQRQAAHAWSRKLNFDQAYADFVTALNIK